jgi:predicted ATPase
MIRIVITGGPSTGKTSLINQLSSPDRKIFHEVARIVIKEQLQLKSNKVPWDDITGFSQLVLKKQIEDFNNAENTFNIYDRGIPDLIGYMNHGNKTLFKDLELAAKSLTYQFVFILPPWQAIYETDNERRESFKEAIKINQNLTKAYIDLGYTPIEIPQGTLENRLNFILEKING